MAMLEIREIPSVVLHHHIDLFLHCHSLGLISLRLRE
jgi:hypothetical protein